MSEISTGAIATNPDISCGEFFKIAIENCPLIEGETSTGLTIFNSFITLLINSALSPSSFPVV